MNPQEATGPLTVKSGTLGFDWGATWAKGTEVNLEGGTLKVGAESVSKMFVPAGTYTKGDGSLRVRNSSDQTGLMLQVR